MIPQQQIQDTILTAQLKAADMTLANINALTGGQLYVDWQPVNKAQRGINAVLRQYNLGDYGSSGMLMAYSCLQGFVGTYAGGSIDPNAQNPNTVIDVIESGVIKLTFSDADLLDAGGGNWYLPWTNAATPVSVTDNEVSFTFQYDESVVPARIYGFSSGAPTQVIVVVAI